MAKGIQELFVDELADILSAEQQIVKALPAMVKAADARDLKEAYAGHLKETKEQVKRLEKIFKLLQVKKKVKLCKATKGLIDECKEVLQDFTTKSPIRDVALISKTQRIEHYEISAYGTLRNLAQELNLGDIAKLLQETLDEEGGADRKLSKIAEGGLLTSGVNHLAHKVSDQTSTAKKLRPKMSSVKKVTKKKSAVKKHKTAAK